MFKKLERRGVNRAKVGDSPVKLNYALAYHEKDPRPYLNVRVFGSEFKALLDSGASQTILGHNGLWILDKFPVKIHRTEGKFVQTADSKNHSISGYANLPITLQGRTEDLCILVVPSLPHGIILGIDFWERFHIVADMRNRNWEFAQKNPLIHCSALDGIQSEDHLTVEEKQKLQDLVDRHFENEPSTLGRTDRVEHHIDTGEAREIKQRYYAVSPARQKMINEELDKMLELGVVEPSQSGWSSPILLLDKPDGTKRFCVDFRKLNEVSKKDAYPLPQVTTILDRLREARYLSSLDIKSAYWQIPLEKESKEKTAFTIPGRGLFQFCTLPFGLCNAPATWQRFVDNVLGADLEPYVFVYLDDIILVTPTFEKHLEILAEIFKRIRAANLTLNREKCQLCRRELKYLGYVVSEEGLRVDPEKVKSILEMPIPRSQKEVRQFVGTASWYRRFIPDFATRLYPLTNLLKKRTQFEWSQKAHEAFLDIRSCLVTSPILSCPDFSKPFIVSCDASGCGLGAVLSQESDRGEVVVAYASRTLGRQEQKYSATERECLAVIWAVERFRPYIEGTRFRIITDHYSLLWLSNLRDPQGRLARWALRLQPYDFELIHRKGKENVVPDLLSRTTPIEDTEKCALVVPCEVKDKWYQGLLVKVAADGEKYPQWKIIEQQLWKRVNDPTALLEEELTAWKLVIPKDLRAQALQECHDDPTAGHQGIFKTYRRLQLKYYWPKMRQDTATYVSKCKICQSVKYDQRKPAGMMGELRIVSEPWKMVATDLMGPFPRSLKGFKYILVVTDTFTKYSVLFPLRSATAKTVAQRLEDDIFMVYGVPQYLICDNGSEFVGAAVKKLALDYKVKTLYNASRHPQANPTERVNRNIITMLRAYVGENHREWDQRLAQVGFALRTAVHETTGHSPAFLNFGREPAASGEGSSLLVDQVPAVQEDCTVQTSRLQELRNLYQDITQKLRESHQKNSHHYNLRRRPQEFKVGDLVWKKNYTQSNAATYQSAKLNPRYVGPFTVVKKASHLVYSLKDGKGKAVGNWHVNDLKTYIA